MQHNRRMIRTKLQFTLSILIFIDLDVSDFIQHKHDLEVHGGCLFYGERIVIQPKLYFGHPGECRMELLAAEKVFWPKITKDIERAFKTCKICANVSKTPIKTTLQLQPVPSAPWQRLHFDNAGPIDGNYFLIIGPVIIPQNVKVPEPAQQRTLRSPSRPTKGMPPFCSQ